MKKLNGEQMICFIEECHSHTLIYSGILTQNQDNPFMSPNFGGQILLGMDVWEHAYYLKHQADRKAHIKDFFAVVDWDVVAGRLK